MKMKGGWVIDVDVQDCFGSLDHGVLRSFLDKRVRDGVLRRAIDKWLKAGVMEDGHIHYPDSGSPQGGVISPVLANLYLHEVMDVWFEEMVKPVLRGQAFMIRFADDSIMVFALEDDARRVYRTLPKRFAKYGLTIHPDKTHLLRFRKPPRDARGKGDTTGGPRPATSDFLGFTHYWARSLQGYWVVKRKTAASRFVRALRRIADWCRRNRHRPVAEQHPMLIKKLRGHYEYYGITGNSTALARFRYAVEHTWKRWLERRSQRAAIGWDRFERFRERYPLPSPICAHSILRRVAKP